MYGSEEILALARFLRACTHNQIPQHRRQRQRSQLPKEIVRERPPQHGQDCAFLICGSGVFSNRGPRPASYLINPAPRLSPGPPLSPLPSPPPPPLPAPPPTPPPI